MKSRKSKSKLKLKGKKLMNLLKSSERKRIRSKLKTTRLRLRLTNVESSKQTSNKRNHLLKQIWMQLVPLLNRLRLP